MTHEGTIEAAGTTFHYRATGSGRLVLLLHGFGMDSRVWDLVLQRVGPGRQCVAVDLRGAGRTPLGADLTLPLERHADDVAALVAAFGARSVDLVGFSMGGFGVGHTTPLESAGQVARLLTDFWERTAPDPR